ncbi:acyltransferase family protein [Brachybacterium timonense]|uniref:acyltransferase family protein n=1 Tax=Brachybacterium timonense TaxID=2050896 RepID=UPI001FE6D8DA|nr:acyltransferase family protein [Brachybacterium timonense]
MEHISSPGDPPTPPAGRRRGRRARALTPEELDARERAAREQARREESERARREETADADTDTGTDADTGTATDTGPGTGTDSGAVTATDSDADTGPDTGPGVVPTPTPPPAASADDWLQDDPGDDTVAVWLSPPSAEPADLDSLDTSTEGGTVWTPVPHHIATPEPHTTAQASEPHTDPQTGDQTVTSPAVPTSADDWETPADPLLESIGYLADDLGDWLQGPIEQEAEQDAEDAWSTGRAVSRRTEEAPARTGEQPALAPAGEGSGSAEAPQTPAAAAPARPRSRAAFRGELHGLRAVALGLVAIYHVWLGRVSGGVDVFLFLSAFFLTGTFVRRLESGRPLGIPRYWLHTFKRLLPPAAVTIVATLAATWAWLPQSLWPTVMEQAGASALYVQNVLLVFQEVDYAARDAGAASPLQHFWSLSVQGQIFAAWPLLFLLALPFARRGRSVRRPLLLVMLIVFGASLAWSITETVRNQPVAYFDTTARLWEFAAGSMLALSLRFIDRVTGAARPEDDVAPRWRTARALLGWIGLIALLACGMVLNVATVFPGWIALWPLAAAGAVVIAGYSGRAWGVDRLLSTRPAAFIGDISYALYLVHWPVLVVWLHHSGQERAGLADGFVVLLASVVLAWLLTRIVDAPIRHSTWLEARPWRALTAVAASIALVLGTAGGWWYGLVTTRSQVPPVVSDGGGSDEGGSADGDMITADQVRPYGWELPEQWPDLPERCAGAWAPSAPFREVNCQQALPGDASVSGTIVVVGSSHARQFIPAVLPEAQRQNLQVVNLSMSGCTLTTPETEGDYCAGYHDYVMAYLAQVKPTAVLTTVTRTTPDSAEEIVPAGTDEAVQSILDSGITVVGVRDTPRWPQDQYQCPEAVLDGGGTPADADAQCGAPRAQKVADVDPATDLLARTGAPRTDGTPARILGVDLSDRVCPDGRCAPIVGTTYVYLDDNHLTRQFVEQTLTDPLSVTVREATIL